MAAAQIISTDRHRALVGIGVTGASVARYFVKKSHRFTVFDTRQAPPGEDQFRADFPDADIRLGSMSADSFVGCDELVLSPGVAPDNGIFPELKARGIDIVGDIELFAREAKAPVIAITGSNAKSTVTSLVGEMAKSAGMNAGIGGNLGVPALDLLDDHRDLYVLELSSFQLETTYSLSPEVACILNLSQDHMDRYGNMIAYHRAKQRIYSGAKQVVCNRDDDLTMPLLEKGQQILTFGAGSPDLKQFGILNHSGSDWLVVGSKKLIAVSELGIKGRHNHVNALAALAIGTSAGLPLEPMLIALKSFKGLPHRCETISERQGVSWINDSKATNAGAVIAAIEGFSVSSNADLSGEFEDITQLGERENRRIILIAGGQAKGQKFTALAKSIQAHVKQLILIGEDADQLGQALSADVKDQTSIVYAVNMDAAVQAASSAAVKGDSVLLSPACASFDMFEGYQARGRSFAEAVERLQ